jgi:hypothetical protein
MLLLKFSQKALLFFIIFIWEMEGNIFLQLDNEYFYLKDNRINNLNKAYPQISI